MSIDNRLSEEDVRAKYITPALIKAGWNEEIQIRREVRLTDGRIIVRGKQVKRKHPKRADFVLYYKQYMPIVVIEAKDASHSLGDGMQQALKYAKMLDVPYTYSSNGRGFLEHDLTGKGTKVETEISMDDFPPPEALWNRYKNLKGYNENTESIIKQDYYSDGSGKSPSVSLLAPSSTAYIINCILIN